VKVDTLIATEGPVFHLASLPETTRATVRSGRAAGRLVRVLPGTYVPTELKDDFATRSLAVGWWCADTVIVGAAAARLTFWPDVPVRQIDVARRGTEPIGPGYRFHRRAIDPEYIVERHGLRMTTPALTAIDLVDEFGGDAIDICLRSRAARLSDLWAAYAAHPARPGNAERRRMLLDSRDKPWSAARALVASPTSQPSPQGVGRDRYRQNALVLAGWRVLRFTYRMLVDEPDYVIATILAALATS